jgi:hypothetical protein
VRKVSWTVCRIRVRSFVYIVKPGQPPGPKTVRYRKRRNHAAVFGCYSHPDDFDPSVVTEAMERDIDVLNEEMVAAGVRIFVGGLTPVREAKSLRA